MLPFLPIPGGHPCDGNAVSRITISLVFRIIWLQTAALIFLLTFYPLSPLHAQDYQIKFEHVSREQGIFESAVNCIFQDRKGFLWFGTQNGLQRYDGYTIIIYKNDPDDSTSLSDNKVNTIYEDRSGVLWIGTNGGGLNQFDQENERFRSFKNIPGHPNSLSNNNVSSILEDESGILWIGTIGGGLTRMHRDEAGAWQFKQYRFDANDPHSLSHPQVHSLHEDRAGMLWVGTFVGLDQFDRENEIFRHVKNDPNDPNSLSGDFVKPIFEDQTGAMWFGTSGGLFRLQQEDQEEMRFMRFNHDPETPNSLSHNSVTSIAEDRFGFLWIGTLGGGLSRMHRDDWKNKSFTHFQHDPNDPNSLNGDRVRTIFTDRSGMLWIGTMSGVDKVAPQKMKFKNYNYHSNYPPGLAADVFSSLFEDRSGLLWIGTAGNGLLLFDRKNDAFKQLQYDPGKPRGLSKQYVTAICEDRQGDLWFGTNGGGLLQMRREDRGKGIFTHFRHDPDDPYSLGNDLIWSILEESKGELWIGTSGGLSRMRRNDRGELAFTNYRHDPKNPNSLGRGSVMSIYEDRAGSLWFGTFGGGLNQLSRETESFTHYLHEPENPNSLGHNTVYSIRETSDGALWIGTTQGLDRLTLAPLDSTETPDLERQNVNRAMFSHYREKDGLPGNIVYGILEDDNGNLWVSTNNGLSRLVFAPDASNKSGKAELLGRKMDKRLDREKPPLQVSFVNFSMEDGLPSNKFIWGASHKNKNGEMFFGGTNGFIAFHPDSIKDNPYIPPVVITAFEKFDTDRSEQGAIAETGISAKQEVALSYKNTIFSIEFAALNYVDSHKNRYAYKLEGFNDNWIQLGTQRRVTFTNLDAGQYVFRVKGSNNDGIWNEEGASLKITIAPPWWKTWWAYTLYGVIFFSLLYSLRRYEMNRQQFKHRAELEHVQAEKERVEAEKLKELDHLKSRFFANISHEFRTPLTLILGPLENLLTDTFVGDAKKQYGLMKRNAQRLLRLINQLLDLSKLEAGKLTLEASYGNLIPFLKGLVYSFESLALRKNIALHFEAEMDEVMLAFDRDKMEQIITNLLSNAFKFTREGGIVAVAVGSSSKIHLTSATATAAANFVTIIIRDTGVGIPADRLPHIFDRFYQAGDSYAKDQPAPLDKNAVSQQTQIDYSYPTGQGTGIGLALTKELVELHGGEIRVTSEVGKGTEFMVQLPVASDQLPVSSEQFAVGSDLLAETAVMEQAASSIQQPATSGEQPATSNEQPVPNLRDNEIILIVEDNPDMRAFIREQLQDTYQILEAEDGRAGLEQAIETIPDLIISDVMMPKMDGYQLCAKLKTDERTSHVPVVLLTAKSSGESKIEGLELGADDYLIKPFDRRELLARVKNLIAQRRKLRQRFSGKVALKPSEIAVTSVDRAFLERALTIVEKYIDDEDFDVETLAGEVAMSRRQLHRKLHALIDQAPSEFILSVRLQRAAELLQKQAGTVAEIAYMTGFNTPNYFAKCFRKQFGYSPAEYRSLHG